MYDTKKQSERKVFLWLHKISSFHNCTSRIKGAKFFVYVLILSYLLRVVMLRIHRTCTWKKLLLIIMRLSKCLIFESPLKLIDQFFWNPESRRSKKIIFMTFKTSRIGWKCVRQVNIKRSKLICKSSRTHSLSSLTHILWVFTWDSILSGKRKHIKLKCQDQGP